MAESNEIDLTEDQMTADLLEFHQRNQANRVQVSGIPDPVEVKSSIQHLGPTKDVPTKLIDDERDRTNVGGAKTSGGALGPKKATAFDLYCTSVTGDQTQRKIHFQFYIACHFDNEIGTAQMVIVKAYPLTYWGTLVAVPPIISASVRMAFSGTAWTPTMHGQGSTPFTMDYYPNGLPPAPIAPNPLRPANGYFQIYCQGYYDGVISTAIYGMPLDSRYVSGLQWTASANGIGGAFNFLF